MQTQLRYWRDRRTDRWLFSFICIDIHSISICVLTFLLEYIFIIIVPQPIKLFVPLMDHNKGWPSDKLNRSCELPCKLWYIIQVKGTSYLISKNLVACNHTTGGASD